ncbi:hypothetical protein IAU60_003187 [Kwoniella sp. DSM 27419]
MVIHRDRSTTRVTDIASCIESCRNYSTLGITPHTDSNDYTCDCLFHGSGRTGPTRYLGETTPLSCSVLPGAAFGATTCDKGRCEVFACDEGYDLVDGVCVASNL